MKKYISIIVSTFCCLIFLSLSASASQLTVVTGSHFITDLRYNTDENFLKKNVYKTYGINQCFVSHDLAKKLYSLEKKLEESKLKIVFWDCFRPISVQREMWKITPDERYVANPQKGSNHNRGTAIDITLADESGKPLDMPTTFDDFTPKASANFSCDTSQQLECSNREKLKQIMSSIGMKPIPTEWWHFQIENADKYPLIEAFPHD